MYYSLNLRSKGLIQKNGRLFKGCVKNAFTKLSIGSIPSNYQSVIYSRNEKIGFGTSQQRFRPKQTLIDDEDVREEPKTPVIPNINKKGYGSLIAREKRTFLNKPTYSPGPGDYFIEREQCKTADMCKDLHKKPITNVYRRSKYDHTIEKQNTAYEKALSNLPGPGQYHIRSSFDQSKGRRLQTREQRLNYVPKSITPGPGCYIQDTPLPHHAAKLSDHCQVPPLCHSFLQSILHKEATPSPGPGAYDQFMPDFKPLYEKIKISSNFVMKSNHLDEAPQQQLITCLEEKKEERKLIDWPCFMSQTKRSVFGECRQKLGPNMNRLELKEKKNFHFNIKGNWY